MESKSPTQRISAWLDRPLIPALPQLTIETFLIALIMILAILSRFYNLDLRVMAHDEVNHVIPSYNYSRGQGYAYDPVTHGPLQFHLIALSYFLFGDSDFSSRIPAALFSIAAVLLTATAFRRYLGRTGAIIAAVLFLISPYMMFYGRYTRNEAFMQVWGVLTLYATLRYLEKGDRFSLILLTVTTALHFTDKATAFIYTGALMIFLVVVFLKEIAAGNWRSRSAHDRFVVLVLIMLALVISAVGLGYFEAKAAKAATTAAETLDTAASVAPASPKALSPLMLGIFGALGGAVVAGVLALVALLRNLGWSQVRYLRTFDLLILLGTLVLPMLSPFIVYLIGGNPLDYSSSAMLRTGVIIALLAAAAGVIGWLWKPRLWVTCAVLFYAIFTVLFTSFFTNGKGFFMGLVASLGYWLSQQSVERGTQPLYYYALVQIPIYEYLPALGTLLALGLGSRLRRFWQRPDAAPAEQADAEPLHVQVDENLAGEALPGEHPSESNPLNGVEILDAFAEGRPIEESAAADAGNPVYEGQKPASSVPVLALLLYWAAVMLVAFSLAGERMPWLTVNITLPMILASGWALGWLVDTTPWKELANRRGLLALLLLPVVVASLAGVLRTWLGATPPFQGSTIEQLQVTSTFLLSAIVLALSVWGLLRQLFDWSAANLLRLFLLASFAFLAVLTARTAYTASFINYDNANEFLVYAHAARGPKEMLAQIEEISRRTVGDKQVVVAYDSDGLYPFWWYLRDYPNKKFYGDTPSRDLKDATIIIASEANWRKIEPIVKEDYVYQEFFRLWWPMEGYQNLTVERIWNAFTDPAWRGALIDIWLNRDFTAYAKLTGATNLTLNTWQPSAKIRLYIRKDVIGQIWNYGVAPAQMAQPKPDPYASKMVQLLPDAAILGQEPGAAMNAPRAIAIAKDGSLYVADSRNNRILHFSADGKLINQWGTFADISKTDAPGGTMFEPWGVAVGPDGSVYVTDTWNHRVQKFTADGKFLLMWGYFGQAETPEAFWGPRGIVVDSQGRVYVADTGNKRIAVFDSQGKAITSFGSAGMEPGQFDEPVGLAIDKGGKIYVADTWNQRVQIFTPNADGTSFTPSLNWTIDGWDSNSLENKPFIAVDQNLNVFITDPEGYRVLEFDSLGQFVRGWGEYSSSTDGFGLPSGIAVDAEGRVWVSDAGNNLLLRFSMPNP